MRNWYRYWRRIGHVPKKLCEEHVCLDSFKIFKTKNFCSLIISKADFSTVVTRNGENLQVIAGDLKYIIPVEKQPCQFGGFRYFLRCPGSGCNRRMRKLYHSDGYFLCRKCLHLGYFSQRSAPAIRFSHIKSKLEKSLKGAGGALWQKPKWMHRKTHEKLKERIEDYEKKHSEAMLEVFYKM